MHRHAVVISWICCLLALGGCNKTTDKTALGVTVTTDYAVPAEMNLIRIVLSVDGKSPKEQSFDLSTGPYKMPLQVVLVPGGADDQEITVTAIGQGMDQGAAFTVQQQARLKFIAGEAHMLYLHLARACKSQLCEGTGSTCNQGQCNQQIAVDSTKLPFFDPKAPTIADASVSADAPEADASDAGRDVEPRDVLVNAEVKRSDVSATPQDAQISDATDDVPTGAGGTGGTGGTGGQDTDTGVAGQTGDNGTGGVTSSGGTNDLGGHGGTIPTAGTTGTGAAAGAAGAFSSGGTTRTGGALGGTTSSASGGATVGGASGGTAVGGASGGATVGGASGGTAVGGASGGATVGGASGGTTVGGASGGTTVGGATGGTTTGGATGGTTTGGATGGTATGGATGGNTATGGTTSTGPSTGPCDIYAAANMPCAAAYSVVRVLSKSYIGPLFQVRAGSSSTNNTMAGGTTKDIMPGTDGYVDKTAVDDACAGGTYCTVSVLYDQSGNDNHLMRAPKGTSAGGSWGELDDYESIATKGQVTAGGHTVYSLYMKAHEGYRTQAGVVGKNMPVELAPQGTYELADGTRKASACCWDFGNVMTTPATGPYAFADTICLGHTWWGNSTDSSWYGFGADFEGGVWAGGSKAGDPGWGALSGPFPFNANNPSMANAKFALAFLRVSSSEYALRVADVSTASDLSQAWKGGLPATLGHKGGIVLGVAPDNGNNSFGTFYEGAMVAGYPTNEIDLAVMKNIQAVGYTP